jgi:hypothetical protein
MHGLMGWMLVKRRRRGLEIGREPLAWEKVSVARAPLAQAAPPAGRDESSACGLSHE